VVLGIDEIPLIGLPESLRNPGIVPLAGLAVCLAGVLIARRAWTQARVSEIEGPRAVRTQRWIELSSYHDPVGRLLLPRLPEPAIEGAVAVGGHPIVDHVAYFRRSSILPWLVAGEVFKTLKVQPQRAIALTTGALQLAAERRRLLRTGLFVAVLFGGTLPLVAAGRSLIAAIATLAVVLLGVSFILSLAFLLVETRANRRRLDALRAAIRDDTPFRPPRLPVPVDRRRAPAWIAFGMSVLTFCVMFPLAGYPPGESSAGAFMLLTVLFTAYCAAIVAGYRPSRWFLVLLAYTAIARYLSDVPPWPHVPSMPDVYAIPAVPAIILIAVGVVSLVVLLRPRRLAGASGAIAVRTS
jgi:hypothetical protein